jgi:Tol biopolymer transport system component
VNAGTRENEPEVGKVRAELERILASTRFSNNPSLSRFLRHTVEETLAGRRDTLKEYLIGLDVFHRGDAFDPRIDPIVRVQAGKLRTRLQEYYESEGAGSEISIELPKGAYVPSFRYRAEAPPVSNGAQKVLSEPHETEHEAPAGRRVGWKWLILAAVAAASVIVGIVWLRGGRGGELSPPVQVTANVGATIFPTISRDGRLLAYSSDRLGNRDLDLWVQSATGGEAVRLTTAQGADITPDFSPDGTQVVFRSRREAGGLYVVSVLGGFERRLSDFGWRPRYSPDGKFIAFSGESKRTGGDLYVLPAAGGEPKLVSIGNSVELGGVPIWSRDGKQLLFSGRDGSRRWDFWVVPVSGGKPVSMGLAHQLSRQGLGEIDQETVPGDWMDGDLVFALVQQGISNLWRAPVSGSNLRISGPLRRITSGSAMELSPRVSGDGRIVFSGDYRVTHLFSLPLASPGEDPTQLTADASLRPGHFRTPIRFSAGAHYLVYSSRRAGTQDIILRDLASGAESMLAGTADAEEDPLISPDESAVVYTSGASLWLVEVKNRLPRKLCNACGRPLSWLPDSRRILLAHERDQRLAVLALDVNSGASAEWLADPEFSFSQADVSADSNWIAFTSEAKADADRALWVAPIQNGRPAARPLWVRVEGGVPESALEWDQASQRLYFFSSRDGFRCLWSIPWSRGHAGAPEEVHHWPGIGKRPWNSWVSVGGSRLVFGLTDSNSNIFLIDPASNRLP